MKSLKAQLAYVLSENEQLSHRNDKLNKNQLSLELLLDKVV